MHESLKLFKEICNNRWFVETAMLLFLNKRDLFEEKVKTKSITIAFPDYKGDGSYDDASQYIQNQFIEQNENPKKPIYPHITAPPTRATFSTCSTRCATLSCTRCLPPPAWPSKKKTIIPTTTTATKTT